MQVFALEIAKGGPKLRESDSTDPRSGVSGMRGRTIGTKATMEQLAKGGTKRIAVVMPGFAADCLETLEEIAQENAHIFKLNGGEAFSAIPCLNDSDGGMNVVTQLVLRELQGWI